MARSPEEHHRDGGTVSGASNLPPADELLSTKVTIPRVRPDALVRGRLFEALDEALERKMTLVCSPAGFGKTTLLADWASRKKGPVAWLSLDRDDGDPARFWRYVAAALERAGVSTGERFHSLLEARGGGPSAEDLTTALNALQALSEEVTLVLDDYHTIEARPVHDDMTFFVEHLSAPLHLVVASRTDLSLPLAKLRASDQIIELRAADLRFTPEESAAFLRDVWGLDLQPATVFALESRTEGWAVGLQLAALSLRNRPDPDAFVRAFTGTNRYILDYLSEQVLERQPERIRTFLLETSILERLTGPLCDAVTGGSDGKRMLEELERANLFLVPLDDERRWYRLHQLFADLLRARLQQAGVARLHELHRRAAEWCERHGLIDEAIHHAIGADEKGWAARLVEEHLWWIIGRDDRAIERWLSRLTDDVVRSRPALCLAEGLRQLFLGRLDAAASWADEAERTFASRHGEQTIGVLTQVGVVGEVPAAIALLRSFIAGARGDPQVMAAHARSAEALMAEVEQGPRFWARALAGTQAAWMQGRLADAEGAAADMLAEARASPHPEPGMVSTFPLGRIQQARGALSAALRTHREGLQLADEDPKASRYHAGLAHLGIAQVLYERDQLDEALTHLKEAAGLGRQMIWFRELERITSAWIHQAMGDAESALDSMDEACRAQASLWPLAPSERARLLLAQGRMRDVEQWAEDRGLSDHEEVSYLRERDHLVLARVLLAGAEPERALALLRHLDELARSQGREASLIQILSVRSLALEALGDRPGAFACLSDALALARPERQIRVFADEGPPMAALLRRLVRAGARDRPAGIPRTKRDHPNRVIRAFRLPSARAGTPGAAGTPVPLIEPLTPRELEILGSVAAGRRNREIADELVVTLDTVKKHLSHIFDKLGASTRTEAVARARELDLIQ
jgi:ATP/maltotriose-dependent transcriptional regulator MalT